MSLLRCFLAVEVPGALQARIQAATAESRARLGPALVRWVPAPNIHLTLKFLGDTSPSAVELIEGALTAAVPQYKQMEVVVAGFGAFPGSRKPRVLWIGLTAPAVLGSLQHELDVATARLGYASEERGFSPHLTVGRVRQNLGAPDLQKIRDELEQTSVGKLGSFAVDAVHLFRSELQATGSVYSKLLTVPLSRP